MAPTATAAVCLLYALSASSPRSYGVLTPSGVSPSVPIPPLAYLPNDGAASGSTLFWGLNESSSVFIADAGAGRSSARAVASPPGFAAAPFRAAHVGVDATGALVAVLLAADWVVLAAIPDAGTTRVLADLTGAWRGWKWEPGVAAALDATTGVLWVAGAPAAGGGVQAVGFPLRGGSAPAPIPLPSGVALLALVWSAYFDAPGGVGPGLVALVSAAGGSTTLLGSFLSEEGPPDWFEAWDGQLVPTGALAVTANGTLAHIGAKDGAGGSVVVSVDLRQGAQVGRVALPNITLLGVLACEGW